MKSDVKRHLDQLYGAEWRLEGEDVSHIHVGYWYDDTPILDIKTAHETYLREVFSNVPFEPDDTVLDVGAGNGATAIWVAETFGCKVHAVDIVDLHAQAARRGIVARGLQERITVTCADIAEMEFAAATFDHAYSLECLHHAPDRTAVFARLGTWIKPGGHLALAEQTLRSDCRGLSRWAVEQISGSRHMSDLASYRHLLETSNFPLHDARDVTRSTFLKAKEWERRDPGQQIKKYTRETYGALAAFLMPAVFILAERAARRGHWSLQFITAQRT